MKRTYSFYCWAAQTAIAIGLTGLYVHQPFPLLDHTSQGPPAFHLKDFLCLLAAGVGSGVVAGVEWRRLRDGSQQSATDGEVMDKVTLADFKEAFGALYQEVRQAVPRARRRWPSKKKELRTLLRRPWSRQERQGVGVYLGGQLLLLALGWWLFPDAGSGSATAWLVAIGLLLTLTNGLLLLFWLAGDDDEGGGRGPRPHPRPLTSLVLKLTLRTRRRAELPIPRTTSKSPVN